MVAPVHVGGSFWGVYPVLLTGGSGTGFGSGGPVDYSQSKVTYSPDAGDTSQH